MMRPDEITPFVRQAIMNSISVNNTYDVFYELRSADCRLFYILAGSGRMVIAGHSYPLHAGMCILFSAGTRYMWQTAPHEMLHCITINFDYSFRFAHLKKPFHPVHSDVFCDESILEQIDFPENCVLNQPIVLPDAHALESTFRRLVTERYLGGEYADALLSSMLKSLILHIVRKLDADRKRLSGSGFELTGAILQYVHEHYSEPMSYQTFAELYHLNPIYINRVFKRNIGLPLHAFLANYRITMAMELLRSTNVGIKEIATMVGFSDLPHFTKTFKKAVGLPPTQYRNASN